MKILVTGGGGYIGSLLTPRLLLGGHHVTVLDGFFYGSSPLTSVASHAKLDLVVGDLTDESLVEPLLARGFDQVIHLAAISNDPSAELDPELTRRVNRDAVEFLMRAAKRNGVSRFIYASSASVYGVKGVSDVTEDLSLDPITDYARFKAFGESVLGDLVDETFTGVSVRAATVCGFAPRLRLDLTINLLTLHALENGKITVFGGTQMRPNVHILDLVDFYELLTQAASNTINGEAFNVCFENASVAELSQMIRERLGGEVQVDVVPSDDLRSYHLSGAKARRQLDFVPRRPLNLAVDELRDAFQEGRIPLPNSSWYRNVRHMNAFPDDFPFEPDSFQPLIDG